MLHQCCYLPKYESEDRDTPAATTWAADFCSERERHESMGSWINSNGIHEAKRRRAIGEREMEREGERERVRG